jgi:uncharacterized membrane protein YfcA
MHLLIVSLASLLAGCVDSIVGGGGLVLIPALFAVYPNAAPATLFGTNKSAGIWGTAIATVQYGRRVQLRWRVLLPATCMALAGAFAGAWLVTRIEPSFLRRALPFILLVVLLYTLVKKELGRIHAPYRTLGQETLIACIIGLVVGWYDGFFGPGAGSFFIFFFVRLLGYDFLNASACAKVLNVSTNLAALTLLAAKGHIWWHVGLVMAVANIAGSLIGTRLALKHGAGFVRGAFIAVVLILILKTGYDAFLH